MRAWEPAEGELRGGGKAWRAFGLFRDLGPERNLKRAAAAFYGTPDGEEPKTHQYEQMKRWSARFDWQSRAQAHDDFIQMRVNDRLEELRRKGAEDAAQRRLRVEERLLGVAESAAQKAEAMLNFPISSRTIVREDEDGRAVEVRIEPGRWTFSTARTMADLAANLIGHRAGAGPDDGEPGDEELERRFSRLSEEELRLLEALYQKAMGEDPDDEGLPGVP
jgi:hypothetical protein